MNPIVKKLKEIEIVLNDDALAQVGADYMRSITPVKSGNAKRKTNSRSNEIRADYAYAKRLDEGWSKQNQTGLIEPTLKYLEQYIQSKVK